MSSDRDQSKPLARKRAIYVTAGFLATTAVHAIVGRGTHPLHVIHVAFGALYLVPIVAAAVWLGARPAIGLALASAAAYLVHARTVWAGDPMENANQAATAAVFVFVGVVSAVLVRAAERERRARLEAERVAQRDAILQAIASLSRALRQRDDGTAAHSESVARMAVRLAESLGLGPARLDILRLAALVHDVGKIGVRDDVLLKADELTREERVLIEKHPEIAAEILRPILGAEEIAEIVLCHHECPDGTGYPRHLLESQISLEARILRVADVFAALVEPRPYKGALSPTEAITRMHLLAGKLDTTVLSRLEVLVARGDLAAGTG
jgi:putative nucleotidyltransferase with HDIG domain